MNVKCYKIKVHWTKHVLVNLCTIENIKEKNKENSDVREIIFFYRSTFLNSIRWLDSFLYKQLMMWFIPFLSALSPLLLQH